MRIWLFNPYGPIPSEPWRPYRFSLLAQALAKRGHEVVWWTSTFAHHGKTQRANDWRDERVEPGFVIRLVPSPAYRAHVGPGRFLRDWVFAVRSMRRGTRDQRPALIVTAESPLTFGFAASRLGEALGVPVVIDVMDLWPELFDIVLPPPFRGVGRVAFGPVYADRARRWRRASAMTALCERYRLVAQAVRDTGSASSVPVRTFYNGLDVTAVRAMAAAVRDDDLPNGSVRLPGVTTLVFASTLGTTYDVSTMLTAVQRARAAGANVRLLVAGAGPMLPNVEAAAQASPDGIRYLGRLDPAVLSAVYRHGDVGLCAYGPASNVGMPDKIYDYTTAGLAIINSLPGEVEDLVRVDGIGLQYVAGDADSLTACIRRLAADRGAVRTMATRSASVAHRFDQAVQYPAYAAFLEGVAEDRRHDA